MHTSIRENSVRRLLAGLILCLVTTGLPLRAADDHPFTGMVSFGDSLSDVGNLNSVLSSISEKTAQYLTGYDPNYYFNYRFSNGPIWVDQLYSSLGFGAIGTMINNDGVDHINGTNFAWAGSRSGTGYFGGIFPNLLPQLDFYSQQIATNNLALPDPATTLFTVWSGANDVFAHVEKGDPITPTEVAANISTAITTLYNEGGRYFVVPNLPPIGLTPSYLDDPIKGPLATTFVNLANAQLAIELNSLSGSLTGISIFEVDVHHLFLDITADPGAYGFTNITNTAYIRYGIPPYEPMDPPYGETVANPDGYLYWDAAHGTTAANSFIAQAAYQLVVSPIPEPATWSLFLLASLFLLIFRKKFRVKNPTQNTNP